MSDELVVQVGFAKKDKVKRIKREKTYECLSDTQREACGVQVVGVACREGCPFLRVGMSGIHKDQKIAMLEKRLVNFEAEFDTILGQWARKQQKFIEEDKPNDAFIIRRIIEILCEPDLKVAQKKITSHVMKTELPLFRNYYKTAREDIKRLRKIVADHKKLQKLKERK
jgi:hypothetical protein